MGTLEDQWKASKGFSQQRWLSLPLHTSHTHPALVAFPHSPGPWLNLFSKSLLRPGVEAPQEEASGWVILT